MNSFVKKILSITVLTGLFIFGCGSKTKGLEQGDVEPLINKMLSLHVSQTDFNDTMSERTLDILISGLDPWKLYFYQSDIDSFNAFKDKLDDYTKANDYSFLFKIFDTYKKRFEERMVFFNKAVAMKHDFTADEYINLDRDKLVYASDEKEINERWRIFVKYQLLNYMKAGKDIEQAREKLLKKYVTVKKENENISNEKIFSTYLNSFAQALDPHTNYLSSDEYQDFTISMDLALSGIGAVLRSDDGFVYVESIIPGGPVSRMAEADAVKVNDKIIAVAQGDDEPEEIIDVSLRDAVSKIRGKKGTTVKLTVVRIDPKTKEEKKLVIPVVRDDVQLQDSTIKYDTYVAGTGKSKKTIGYIKFPTFYSPVSSKGDRYCSNDFLEALLALKQKKSDVIVVDLRGNPGGSLGEVIRIAGFFIKTGPILQVKSSDRVETLPDNDPNIYWNGPLVVLIDKLSASASEIFAGAIRDYGRGLLVGPTQTFGKGSVQSLMSLPPDRGMKVTIQLFYQPSGTSNNMTGIAPNVTIPDLTQLYDFDESKMKYPLTAKPIKPASYKNFGTQFLSPYMVSMLQRDSRVRVQKDPNFKNLNEKIAKYRKQLSSKIVSLKKGSTSADALEDELDKRTEGKQNEHAVYNLSKDLFLKEAFAVTEEYANMVSSSK